MSCRIVFYTKNSLNLKNNESFQSRDKYFLDKLIFEKGDEKNKKNKYLCYTL